MTMTFERFLRSFSDEELARFATERAAARPPYWRVMRLALQVELARRGLAVDAGLAGPVVSSAPEPVFRAPARRHVPPTRRAVRGAS